LEKITPDFPILHGKIIEKVVNYIENCVVVNFTCLDLDFQEKVSFYKFFRQYF